MYEAGEMRVNVRLLPRTSLPRISRYKLEKVRSVLVVTVIPAGIMIRSPETGTPVGDQPAAFDHAAGVASFVRTF